MGFGAVLANCELCSNERLLLGGSSRSGTGSARGVRGRDHDFLSLLNHYLVGTDGRVLGYWPYTGLQVAGLDFAFVQPGSRLLEFVVAHRFDDGVDALRFALQRIAFRLVHDFTCLQERSWFAGLLGVLCYRGLDATKIEISSHVGTVGQDFGGFL